MSIKVNQVIYKIHFAPQKRKNNKHEHDYENRNQVNIYRINANKIDFI